MCGWMVHYLSPPILFLCFFCIFSDPLPSSRQHLSCGDCLEGKRGDYLTSSMLLCIIIVTSYAHLYIEQFVHGRLDRALILLGLAVFRAPLCLLCTWCYYVKKILITSFSLVPFSVLSLWDWPLTWKTIILQCYYTVGWVI